MAAKAGQATSLAGGGGGSLRAQPGTPPWVKEAAGHPGLCLWSLIRMDSAYNRGRESEKKLKNQWSDYSLFNKSYGSLIAVVKQPLFTSLDHDR